MRNFLRTLGSLKMAVLLLIAIAAVLAWGTFYEARYGTPAVQRAVYTAAWFQAILAFLGVNLAAAAGSRFPWRRRHLPFVLAHVGIIAVLIGGIVGGRFGVEGQLVIPEGQTSRTLRLERKALTLRQPNPGVRLVLPLDLEARAWDRTPELRWAIPLKAGEPPAEISVDRYEPDAELIEAVEPVSSGGSPALELEVEFSGRSQALWLVADDPDRSAARWGKHHLLFLEPASPEQLAEQLTEPEPDSVLRSLGTVVFEAADGSGGPRQIPLPPESEWDRPISVAGTPYRIRLRRIFSDFALTEAGPVNRSESPENPAVLLDLEGPAGTDARLLFAKHPDFSRRHGVVHRNPVRLRYRHPAAERLPSDSVVFLKGGDRLMAVLTGPGRERQLIDPVKTEASYDHPWAPLRFTLRRAVDSARVVVRAVPRGTQVRRPALRLTGRWKGREDSVWVRAGEPGRLALTEDPLVVEYGPQTRLLPFSVRLLDFRKRNHPGTETPAAFESDVELIDPDRDVRRVHTIRMNHPLKYRGYSLFQASYLLEPVETTVLSVRKDPGIPFAYGGCLVVLAGIVGMFVLRGRG